MSFLFVALTILYMIGYAIHHDYQLRMDIKKEEKRKKGKKRVKKAPTVEVFTEKKVNKVSKYLQKYMRKNNLKSLTPAECAELLAKKKILRNDVGSQPAFHFRQMLRDGRDGKIPMVKGAYQERPRTQWYINRVD